MALDDKYDIKKLIDAGKEKGYLTYNEVNDLIPNEIHSPDDLDDLLTTIGTQGIDFSRGPSCLLRHWKSALKANSREKKAKRSSST